MGFKKKYRGIILSIFVFFSIITLAQSSVLKINDSFWRSYWYVFRVDLQTLWPKLKLDDFNKIKENQSYLLPCLQKRYGLSLTQIRREIYNYYLSLPDTKLEDINKKLILLEIDPKIWRKEWVFIEEQLRLRWPELTFKDMQRVKINLENLPSCLKQQYKMTEQEAVRTSRNFIREISQPLFYRYAVSQKIKEAEKS